MECHVITLNRTIDNFYKQQPYLLKAGLVPICFKGVDAKMDDHLKYLDNLTPYCKNFCPTGVIGCGLSHILLAKKLYENGTELAIILEDDAYPIISNLNVEIEKVISETPSNWDIIKLHCDFCKLNVSTTNIFQGSTAAYIINKSGLEKLSNLKLYNHLEIQLSMDSNFHIYKSKKNIFWADEKNSENRDNNSTFLSKFNFNKTGQKTIDNVLAFKIIKIFGYEVTGWNILYITILLIFVFLLWK